MNLSLVLPNMTIPPNKEKITYPIMAYVYIIEAIGDNKIKIGIANNIKCRIRSLQVGCPYKLKLIYFKLYRHDYALEAETKLHKRLEKYRIMGEWFEKEGYSEIKKELNIPS